MMSPRARSILLLALFLALAASAPAQTGGPRLPSSGVFAPDPGFAEAAAMGEPMPLDALITSALLASGTQADRLPSYSSRIASMLRGLAAELGQVSDQAARAEAVLSYLHRTTLRAYSENATTIDGILDTGSYNCVSSALLYLIAARSLGLSVSAVKTPDHAFATVSLPGREVDVETTNARGFDPGSKKEFTDSFGKVTGFAYVPPGDYARRTRIGEHQLVGLVLSNRISLLERSQRFEEALRLGLDLDALQPDRESRSLLIDRVNNVVTGLTGRRDFEGAEAFASAALAALGNEPRLAQLARLTAYNRVAGLAEAGRWDEALDRASVLLKDSGDPGPRGELQALISASLGNAVNAYLLRGDFQGARRLLDQRRALAGDAAVASIAFRIGDAELSQDLKTLPFRDAVAAADRLLSAASLERSRWQEAMRFLFGNEANRIGRSGDWLGASALASEGAKRTGDASLAREASVFRDNFIATAHNSFASRYNSRDYAGAAAVARDSLALVPGDRLLQSDLDMATKALGN